MKLSRGFTRMSQKSICVAVLFLAGSISVLGQSDPKKSDSAPNAVGTSPAKDAAVTADRAVEPEKATPQAPSNSNSTQDPAAVKIGAGDLLDIKVFNVPELTDQIRVSSDGSISLPLAGTVKVDGLSPAEAEKAIAARLVEGNYLRDPHVSVFVKEYVTQGISVMGEVTKP